MAGRYDAEAKGVQAFMEDQGTEDAYVDSEDDQCQARYLHVAVTNTHASTALSMSVMVSMKEVMVESGAAFWSVSALASMLAVAVATLI